MDEPLSNLDARLRVQTRAEIIKLQQRLGTTTIYVTHNQVEAMTMGDRIAVMSHGVLQQLDTPQNLYDHPANLFVATFIGSPAMNFCQMRVQAVDGHARLVGEHFSLPVAGQDAAALADYHDATVTVGIRREDIVDRRLDGRLPADAVIAVKVEVVETLGPEQYDYLETGAGDAMVARMPPGVQIRVGNTVDVVLPPDRLYFFDTGTGDAIRAVEVGSVPEAG